MITTFRALDNRNYRMWVGGALVSNIGTWMQRVAQDWLVLTVLTDHSGTAVGVTTSLQFLPMLILGPYAGLLADRHSKRRILLLTQAAMGICALVVGLLVVVGSAQLWHICLAAFAWAWPAHSTVLPGRHSSRKWWARTTCPTRWR